MSSGGGSSQQEALGTWSPIMTGYWAGPEGEPGKGFLERVANESNKGYTPYQEISTMFDPITGLAINSGKGQRIADWTDAQRTGAQFASNLAFGNPATGESGTPLGAAGRNESLDTVQGKYLNNLPTGASLSPEVMGEFNTWNGPFYNEKQSVAAAYKPQGVSAGSNSYIGADSTPFLNALGAGQSKIVNAYKKGTEAETRKMMNMAGIFGGGAHMNAKKDNEEALGETLNNYSTEMINAQLNRSGQLEDSDLSRKLQAGTFNAGQDASAYENWASRDFAGSGSDLARKTQGYQNYLGNKLAANQFNAGQVSGNWNQERNRMAGQVPIAMGNDAATMQLYKDAFGFGKQGQDQMQRYLDNTYTDWTQNQNWNKGQLGWLGNMLAQAQGSTGSTMQTSFLPGASVSPIAGLLGGAALGRGMEWW